MLISKHQRKDNTLLIRSDNIGDLVAALAAAQLEFGVASKDSINPYYQSKYADIAAVIGAVRPALNKQGVALTAIPDQDLERQTASMTIMLAKGEQFLGFETEAPAVGKTRDGKDRFDIQTLSAVWTYLRRTGTSALCGLAQEDDDGNAVVQDQARPVPAKKPAPVQVPAQPQPVQETPKAPEPKPAPVKAGPTIADAPPPSQANAEKSVRSDFFRAARELGWSLADIKSFLSEAFGEFQTSKLSEEQLNDALSVMANNTPEEVKAIGVTDHFRSSREGKAEQGDAA